MMRKHRSYVSMLPLSQRPVPSVSSSVAHVCRDICRHARPSPCSSHFRVSLGGPAPGPSPGLQQPVVWGLVGTAESQGDTPDPPGRNLDLNRAPQCVLRAQSARSHAWSWAGYVTRALCTESDPKTYPHSKLLRISRP